MSNPMVDAASCSHEDFRADVTVVRLEDSGLFQAEVQVACDRCWTEFVFPDSVPIGVDLGGVSRDFFGHVLRVAIRPEDRELPNPIEEIAP